MADARPLHNFVILGLVTSILGWNAPANAEVTASPKGLVGGAMLGAELTVIGEAIVGVETEWMYLAGAGIGAVAGGVGGYFVDDTETPGLSVAMLFGGMALCIPALVLSLDATRRHWPELKERRLPTEPTSNPPDPDAGPELSLQQIPKRGNKLLRWKATTDAGGGATFGWSVPDVFVTETFSPAERDRYPLPVGRVIHVPVFAATW